MRGRINRYGTQSRFRGDLSLDRRPGRRQILHPLPRVRRWSWETYWLVGGFFSWIIMPWLMASLLVPDLGDDPALGLRPTRFWAYFFGALWGVGGLTFGLTMRYLGIALGMAVALGYTAVFGTLVPPLFHGTLGQTSASASGKYVLLGVLASVAASPSAAWRECPKSGN